MSTKTFTKLFFCFASLCLAILSCKSTSDEQARQDQIKISRVDSVASLWVRLDSLEKKVDTLRTKTEASLSSLRAQTESLTPKPQDIKDEGAKLSDPHARKDVTADEFGRDLFAILKNKDFEGIKKYLWHDQDFIIIAELGHPATKEQLEEYRERGITELNEGVTRYHDRYFNQVPPTTVEYVNFIPGVARGDSSPRFTNYNDSQLVIRINGSIVKLEIDHIQVIDGVWHISEIR